MGMALRRHGRRGLGIVKDKIIVNYNAAKLIEKTRDNIKLIFGDNDDPGLNDFFKKTFSRAPKKQEKIEMHAINVPDDLKKIIMNMLKDEDVVADNHYGWEIDRFEYNKDYGGLFSSQLIPFVPNTTLDSKDKQKKIDAEIEALKQTLGVNSVEDIPDYMIPDEETLDEYPDPTVGVRIRFSPDNWNKIIISYEEIQWA